MRCSLGAYLRTRVVHVEKVALLGLLRRPTTSIEIRARPLQDLKNIALIAISFILCLMALRLNGRQVIKHSCLSSCGLLAHASPPTTLPTASGTVRYSLACIAYLLVDVARAR